jgi:hypothetical protein
MVNREHKFIFVHIPKTGGTSIEYALDQYNDTDNTNIKSVNGDPYNKNHIKHKHLFLKGYIKKYSDVRENTEAYYKFTIIRNPWDRIASHYHFFKRTNHIHKGSFEGFVNYFCNKIHRGWKCKDFAPIMDYITVDGILAVDFIGKFETVQEDFNTICDRIGIPRQNLPHINNSKHKHYTEYYNNETRAIVAEKYAEDIQRFGYEFGGD